MKYSATLTYEFNPFGEHTRNANPKCLKSTFPIEMNANVINVFQIPLKTTTKRYVTVF